MTTEIKRQWLMCRKCCKETELAGQKTRAFYDFAQGWWDGPDQSNMTANTLIHCPGCEKVDKLCNFVERRKNVIVQRAALQVATESYEEASNDLRACSSLTEEARVEHEGMQNQLGFARAIEYDEERRLKAAKAKLASII